MAKLIRIACQGALTVPLEKLEEFQGGLKDLDEVGFKALRRQIVEQDFSFAPHAWKDGKGRWKLLDGHQRVRVLKKLVEEGYEVGEIPIVPVNARSLREAKLKLLGAASQFGKMQRQGLYEFLHEAEIGFPDMKDLVQFPEIELEGFQEEFFGTPRAPGEASESPEVVTLAEQFLVPPFSCLDARQGYWKLRKEQWLTLGIQSEIGRADNLLGLEPAEARMRAKKATPGGGGGTNSAWKDFGTKGMAMDGGPMKRGDEIVEGTGTSIFDPVLCEVAYRWFSPKGGQVLDPFAGGSVRGVVASILGRKYTGVELRKEQVEANRGQAKTLCDKPVPEWVCGDSREELKRKTIPDADLIFSCPPYADLEVYSEDPRDLSNMPYDRFLECYRAIIKAACAKLKDDRFACFVVGEVRDKKGIYRNFVGHTVQAFIDAGLGLYNEAILLTPIGSLPIRAGGIFRASRKLGKTHQNMLVFVKGNPKRAAHDCGDITVEALEGAVSASE